MSLPPADPAHLLQRAIESGRIHSGYLLSGDALAARALAERFARALVCSGEVGPGLAACGACRDCARTACADADDASPPPATRSATAATAANAPIEIDGTGKRGPLYRHIGDHPDLLWIDRGAGGTRVRIGQVRALQKALSLGSSEGGRRVAIVADAEWLNAGAQNALLRLLEEPPDRTTLVLVAASAAALLATIRSRCQRVVLPVALRIPLRGDDAEASVRELCERLDTLPQLGVAGVLEWAEDFRGERARAAEQVQELLATGSEWLRERTVDAACSPASDRSADPRRGLAAFRTLQACRKDLAQRNANPQMVAERALLALRGAGLDGPSRSGPAGPSQSGPAGPSRSGATGTPRSGPAGPSQAARASGSSR